MAAGILVPTIPFFLLAPSAFWRDVIAIQISRGKSIDSLSVSGRLVYITGLPGLPGVKPTTRLAEIIVAMIVVLALAAFLVRPRPTRLDWFALGTAAASVGALLKFPDFHPHYAVFAAPFIALLVAVSCDRVLRAVANAFARGDRGARNQRLVASVLSATGVVVASWGAVYGMLQARTCDLQQPGYITVADPGPAIAAAVPEGACAITDEPSILITANRFVSKTACPALLDSYYLWLSHDKNPPPKAPPFDADLVAEWQRLFSTVDYVVLSANPFRIPWTPELSAYFNANFHLIATAPDANIYRRTDAL